MIVFCKRIEEVEESILIDDLAKTNHFDVQQVLETLSEYGVASFPFLRKQIRKKMLKEVAALSYEPKERRTHMKAGYLGEEQRVKRKDQEFGCSDASALFTRLVCFEIGRFLEDEFATLSKTPFKTQLRFNHVLPIRYRKGSPGLSVHQDKRRYRNISVFLQISGRATFCHTRKHDTPWEYTKTKPGHVVVMVARGFRDYADTPYHMVTDIEGPRYVLLLSQHKRKPR